MRFAGRSGISQYGECRGHDTRFRRNGAGFRRDRWDDLPQAVQGFDGEADVVEDPFQESLLERSTGMNRDGGTTTIAWPFQREVAAALVERLKPKPLQN